jgi:hypothetical protein
MLPGAPLVWMLACLGGSPSGSVGDVREVSGHVRGTITGHDGEAISGALVEITVMIELADGPTPLARVTTFADGEGSYDADLTVPLLPPQQASVQVHARRPQGGASARARASVRLDHGPPSRDTVEVDLSLPRQFR